MTSNERFYINCISEVMIMKREILKFLKEEEGLTMVEYAIAGALVAAGAATAFNYLGGAVKAQIMNLYTWVSTGNGAAG